MLDLAVSLISSLKFQTANMKNENKVITASSWGSSLRLLPWDDKSQISESQNLISNTIHEWYNAKHRKPSEDEIKLINSLDKKICPYCSTTEIIKNGFYKNRIQRYRCKICDKNFSPLTNTIFEAKKIPISEWIEYLIHLFEFHSIKTSARDNRNSESTGKYWLIKVFEVLKDIQKDVILEGTIYLDETYFPVTKSKIVTKEGKKLRGISRNKIGVGVAFDELGNYLLIVEYTSKPSDTSTWNVFGSHIKEKSHLIHDGERSHGILIRNLKLTSEVYSTEFTKNLDDKENPLKPINNIHALSKRFMKAHGGYDRDNLQDWMNLVWFILSNPVNRYEKIDKFINLAINSPKRMKYREAMSKKSD